MTWRGVSLRDITNTYLTSFLRRSVRKTPDNDRSAANCTQLPRWACRQPLFRLLSFQLLSKFRFFEKKVGFFCYRSIYREDVRLIATRRSLEGVSKRATGGWSVPLQKRARPAAFAMRHIRISHYSLIPVSCS